MCSSYRYSQYKESTMEQSDLLRLLQRIELGLVVLYTDLAQLLEDIRELLRRVQDDSE